MSAVADGAIAATASGRPGGKNSAGEQPGDAEIAAFCDGLWLEDGLSANTLAA